MTKQLIVRQYDKPQLLFIDVHDKLDGVPVARVFVPVRNKEGIEVFCDDIPELADYLHIDDADAVNARSNADLIVRAVNAHDDLLASLKEMREDLISHASYGLNEQEIAMLKRANDAIDKAEGV